MNPLSAGALWVLLLVCREVAPLEGSSEGSIGTKAEGLDLQKEFANSLKLSRKLLCQSRAIASCYRMLKLPGTHLDFTPGTHSFPSPSIGSSHWLRLQAEDRLRFMNEALRVYPEFLEELEEWETQEASAKAKQGRASKPSRFSHKINRARLDLRDLLQHIQLQMTYLGVNVPRPVTPQKILPPTGSEWHKRLLMYRALRSMERTLYRVVREYTVLRLTAI